MIHYKILSLDHSTNHWCYPFWVLLFKKLLQPHLIVKIVSIVP